jgi:putative membrane protein
VRATDALANERTFLAYVRTALAFIGFGFVIARFSLFTREMATLLHVHATPTALSTVFGAGMALAGVLCGAYGSLRYIQGSRALRAGDFSAMPDGAAIGGGLVIAAIGVVVVWTLLTTR